LNGNNRHEEFHIWTGSGGNGKSKIVELYQKVLGNYGCNLPISLLTSSRKSSGEAQPEVARTKGKRFAILQEPDTFTTINVGLMKELTGGDTIMSRALYENPIEFKPQFKMVLTCNQLPQLPYDDEGTWRRVRCVEFKSTFVNEEDVVQDDPYSHLKDPTLPEKFDNWKEAFMWILIQKYDVWRTKGLKPPPSVVNFTKQYREQSDAFADFRDEYIVKDTNIPEPLFLKDVWSAYTEWHTQYGEGKRGSKKELKSYLEKKIGQIKGSGLEGWKGYRLKDAFEDDTLDDALDIISDE
jgi:P4 family phage/plasmid primase-like protien